MKQMREMIFVQADCRHAWFLGLPPDHRHLEGVS
jgi:hypothetical protein